MEAVILSLSSAQLTSNGEEDDVSLSLTCVLLEHTSEEMMNVCLFNPALMAECGIPQYLSVSVPLIPSGTVKCV